MRWHHGREAEVQGELLGLVALIGAVHDQAAASRHLRQRPQQLASSGRVAGLTGGLRQQPVDGHATTVAADDAAVRLAIL